MKSKLLLFGLYTILIFSCKKKDDKPTASTQTNKGMVCKVDGVAWGADKNAMYFIGNDTTMGIEADYSTNDSSLGIFAVRVVGMDTSVIFGNVTVPPSMLGTYALSFDSDNSFMYFRKFFPGTLDFNFVAAYMGYFGIDLSSPGTQTGTFKITAYNPTTKKMSAEFNFNQISSPDANPKLPTITITDGKIEDVTVLID